MNFQHQGSMQQQPITIILFGRTGSGKSYLGNMLAGQKVFEEGQTLHSKTSIAASHIANLPGFPQIIIKIIDTPGFADNRPDMPQEQLLGNILSFLKELEDGFHIGVYCVPAKTRADSHDLEEIKMIGILFGQEVFKHTLIAVTQANTLIPEKRQEAYQNFQLDFPNILSIPSIGPKQVFFADGDDRFQEMFVRPLAKIMETATVYQPQISQDIDPKDPQSIKKVLAKPELQEYMKEYEAILEKQKIQLVEIKTHLDRQLIENQALHQKNLEAQKMHQNQINHLSQQLSQSKISNKQLEEKYREYYQEQMRALESINQKVADQQYLLDRNQQMVDQRDEEIAILSGQVRSLEDIRVAAADPQQTGTGNNDTFTMVLTHIASIVLGILGKSLFRV